MTQFDKPKGYVQIDDLSAAVGFSNIPTDTKKAVIQATGKAVRYRDDGTDPTASVGMSIAAGATLEYFGDLSAIKFIEAEASAGLDVSFYG